MALLSEKDPQPVELSRGREDSPYIFTCDHAGNHFPERWGDFGLSVEERHTHIAWDIGAAAVARQLSAGLGGDMILQTYSRLLIDCNRPHHVPGSIPEKSENTVIESNRNLSPEERQARRQEIFDPYHDAIREVLDDRARETRRTVLVSVHSFTPVYHGKERPMHVGLLFNRDPRLGRLLRRELGRDPSLTVVENEPYAVSDHTDYTIPVHGEQRGIPHVMIEIRNDLISDETRQSTWAERLGELLLNVESELDK